MARSRMFALLHWTAPKAPARTVGSLTAILVFVLAAVSACMGQAERVSLQLMIVTEGERQPLQKPVTVTLLDDWGEVESVQTVSHGLVQFFTKPGVKRLTITGADIDNFYNEFSVGRMAVGMQTVQVRPRQPLAMEARTPAVIALVRLKIPNSAKKEFEKGMRAWDKKDFSKAREHWNKAVGYYADYDLAWHGLGELDLRDGNRQAARVNFQKAIDLNPAFAKPYRELAALLLGEVKYSEAEPLLLKLIQLEPTNVWALSSVAVAQFALGKFDAAIANGRRVHQLPHSGYSVAHLVVANSLESSGRPRDAIDEYGQYLLEDPNGPNAAMARQSLARLSGPNAPR